MSAPKSETPADVDVIQLSDVAPAVDFEKRGGYELYAGPEMEAYQPQFRSKTPGAYFWTGVTFAGVAYNKAKVKPEEAPVRRSANISQRANRIGRPISAGKRWSLHCGVRTA